MMNASDSDKTLDKDIPAKNGNLSVKRCLGLLFLVALATSPFWIVNAIRFLLILITWESNPWAETPLPGSLKRWLRENGPAVLEETDMVVAPSNTSNWMHINVKGPFRLDKMPKRRFADSGLIALSSWNHPRIVGVKVGTHEATYDVVVLPRNDGTNDLDGIEWVADHIGLVRDINLFQAYFEYGWDVEFDGDLLEDRKDRVNELLEQARYKASQGRK